MKISYWPSIFPITILLYLNPGSVLAAEVLTNLADYFRNSDQRAAELLESGDVEAATALFKDSQWRGVGQYRAGNYQEAMENFSLSEDATALYNHGTAAAQARDYNQAVASLEAALELAPDNEHVKQNLDIARELKKLSDQNNPQQPDGQSGQQQEKQESEDGSESQDQSESGSEQSSDEPQTDENQSGESQQESGELDSQQQDKSDESESTEDLENLREEMQQSQAENEDSGSEDRNEKETSASTSVSEDDQATEQWLRRIPDDGSQLLRNKIRLNHLIEYPDVDDMQENW